MKHISHQRDLIRGLSAAFWDHCIFVSSANRGGKLTAFSKHADAGKGERGGRSQRCFQNAKCVTCKFWISSITKPCGDQAFQHVSDTSICLHQKQQQHFLKLKCFTFPVCIEVRPLLTCISCNRSPA